MGGEEMGGEEMGGEGKEGSACMYIQYVYI